MKYAKFFTFFAVTAALLFSGCRSSTANSASTTATTTAATTAPTTTPTTAPTTTPTTVPTTAPTTTPATEETTRPATGNNGKTDTEKGRTNDNTEETAPRGSGTANTDRRSTTVQPGTTKKATGK